MVVNPRPRPRTLRCPSPHTHSLYLYLSISLSNRCPKPHGLYESPDVLVFELQTFRWRGESNLKRQQAPGVGFALPPPPVTIEALWPPLFRGKTRGNASCLHSKLELLIACCRRLVCARQVSCPPPSLQEGTIAKDTELRNTRSAAVQAGTPLIFHYDSSSHCLAQPFLALLPLLRFPCAGVPDGRRHIHSDSRVLQFTRLQNLKHLSIRLQKQEPGQVCGQEAQGSTGPAIAMQVFHAGGLVRFL